MIITYIDAITQGFPNTQVSSPGIGDVYEDLIYEQGDPIPEKSVLDAWIDVRIKADMWKLIQVERDRRKSGGVFVSGNWYHTDDTSRIQQLGLVMFGANMPNNIMWKTMAGNFVLMTPTLALQIFQGVASSDIAIFATAEAKKTAMLASGSPGTYDYLTGWPAIFGE